MSDTAQDVQAREVRIGPLTLRIHPKGHVQYRSSFGGWVFTSTYPADAVRRVAELEEERERFIDSLRNCMGLLDTPIARHRYRGDSLYQDIIAHARDTLAPHTPET